MILLTFLLCVFDFQAERQANQLSDVRDRHIHAEDENKVLLAKMDLLDKCVLMSSSANIFVFAVLLHCHKQLCDKEDGDMHVDCDEGDEIL